MYNENIGLVAKSNTQQHRCILFPIFNFLSSAMILKLAYIMDHPALSQLADVETPTTVGSNIEAPERALDDEVEDFNDISSNKICLSLGLNQFYLVLLVNCPTNSTQMSIMSGPATQNLQSLQLSCISTPAIVTEDLPGSPSENQTSSAQSVDNEQHVTRSESISETIRSCSLSDTASVTFFCACGKPCSRFVI